MAKNPLTEHLESAKKSTIKYNPVSQNIASGFKKAAAFSKSLFSSKDKFGESNSKALTEILSEAQAIKKTLLKQSDVERQAQKSSKNRDAIVSKEIENTKKAEKTKQSAIEKSANKTPSLSEYKEENAKKKSDKTVLGEHYDSALEAAHEHNPLLGSLKKEYDRRKAKREEKRLKTEDAQLEADYKKKYESKEELIPKIQKPLELDNKALIPSELIQGQLLLENKLAPTGSFIEKINSAYDGTATIIDAQIITENKIDSTTLNSQKIIDVYDNANEIIDAQVKAENKAETNKFKIERLKGLFSKKNTKDTNDAKKEVDKNARGGIFSGIMDKIGNSLLSKLKGSKLGAAIGGFGGKALSVAGRFAGPAALIAGAGIAGYQAGKWLDRTFQLSDKLGEVMFNTVTAVGNAPENIKKMFNNGMNNLSDMGSSIKNTISDAITGSYDSLKNSFTDIGSNISEKVTKMFGTIFGGKNLNDIFSSVSDFLNKIPGLGSVFKLASTAAAGLRNVGNRIASSETGQYVGGKINKFIGDVTGSNKARESTTQKYFADRGYDKNQQAMLLGQFSHETGGFSSKEEGKYSPSRVWDLRGKQLSKFGVTKEQVEASFNSGGPNAMYEYMYGDKYRSDKSMGNTEAGDAAKYKGRGLVQLTGKSNYAAASKALGIDLVKNPELAADSRYEAPIAEWYVKQNKRAASALERGDATGLSTAINGGTIGLNERLALTEKYKMQLANQIPEQTTAQRLELAKVNTNLNPAVLPIKQQELAMTKANRKQEETVAANNVNTNILNKPATTNVTNIYNNSPFGNGFASPFATI